MAKQDLKEIVAPSLTQSGYGRGIDDQFKSIDENFRILSNRDFVKGDRGYSVRSNTIYLTAWSVGNQDQLILTQYGVRVIDTILKEYCSGKGLLDLMKYSNPSVQSLPDTLPIGTEVTQNTLRYYLYNTNSGGDFWLPIRPVKTLSGDYISLADTFDGGYKLPLIGEDDYQNKLQEYKDNIEHYINLNSFKIIESYDPAATDKIYTPVASITHWVFRDKRFSVNLSQEDIEKYSGLIDTSCTIHLSTIDNDYNADFVVLHDIPALYFDKDNNSFCWLLGNQKTGMIAQGPRGVQGENTRFFIFKAVRDNTVATHTNADTDGQYNVTHYMDANGLLPWRELGDDTDMSIFEKNNPCIVCVYTKETDPKTSQQIELPKFFYSIINTIVDDKPESEGGLGKQIKVYCSSATKVPDIFTNEHFATLLSTAVGSGSNQTVRGLYVPFDPSTKPQGYKHTMWSESSAQDTSLYDALHISPVNYGKLLEPSSHDGENLYNKNGKLRFDYSDITFGQPESTESPLTYTNGSLKLGGNLSYIEMKSSTITLHQSNGESNMDLWLGITSGNDTSFWTLKNNFGNQPLLIKTGSSGTDSLGRLIISDDDLSSRLSLDETSIQAYKSNAYSPLHLNKDGGDVHIGNSSRGDTIINRNLLINGILRLGEQSQGFDANFHVINNVKQLNTESIECSTGAWIGESGNQVSRLHIFNQDGDKGNIRLKSIMSNNDYSLGGMIIESKSLNIKCPNVLFEGDIDASGKNIKAEKTSSTFIEISPFEGNYGISAIYANADKLIFGESNNNQNGTISWDNFVYRNKRSLYIGVSGTASGDGNIIITITDAPWTSLFNFGIKLVSSPNVNNNWDGKLILNFKTGSSTRSFTLSDGSVPKAGYREYYGLFYLDSNAGSSKWVAYNSITGKN